MKFKTSIALFYVIIIIFFSFQNVNIIKVHSLYWHGSTSKYLVFLGSFMMGTLVGILILMSGKLKSLNN